MKIIRFLVGLSLTLGAINAAEVPAVPTDRAVIIDHGKFEQALTKGGPLLNGQNFKVQAGHRVTAGKVELHENFADVFYVVEGTATLVTEGKMLGETDLGNGEKSGTTIEGGVTHQLQKGDVIVIPAKIPHWFSRVDQTFLYLVVKVKA